MAVVYGTYTTYDSPYLGEDIKGYAALVEPKFTVSWDLLPEVKPGTELEDSKNGRSTIVSWYDAVREDLSGAVRSGWVDDTDITALPIDDALALIVNIGDILKVEDEYVVVKDVPNRGAGTATIDVFARGHGSTVGAAHLAGVKILIVGNAQVEATNDVEGLSADTVKRTNYYSIVQEKIDVSYTYKNSEREDIDDENLDYERKTVMNRALKKINRSVIYGMKEIGSKVAPRSAGGMEEFLNTATYGAARVNAAGAFTEAKLQAILKEVFLRGGTPDTVLMSPKNKQIANGFNLGYLNTTRTERQAGSLVDTYLDQNGEVRFVVDMQMRDDVIFVLNVNKTGKQWFNNDRLRFVVETNVNSRQYVETLQGQYTMWFKDIAFEHGVLYGIV